MTKKFWEELISEWWEFWVLCFLLGLLIGRIIFGSYLWMI